MEQQIRKLCCGDLSNRLSACSKSLLKSLMSENIKRIQVVGSSFSEVPICLALFLSTYQGWGSDPLIICQVSKPFFFFFDLSPVVTPNGPMGYGTYLSSYPPGSQERASSWSPVKRWLVILQGSWNLAKAHLELPLAHTDSAGLRSSNQEGNSLKPQRVLCSLRTESLTVTQTYLLCPSVLHLICKDTEMSLCSKEVIFFVTLSWASDPSAPS